MSESEASKLTLYFAASYGDFEPCFHPHPVSIAKVGDDDNLPPVHAVFRRDTDGNICLLAMNAFCGLKKFEVFIDRDDQFIEALRRQLHTEADHGHT